MREIIAIIRPNKIGTTKEVLAAAGFPSLTAARVQGRGKQKGLFVELNQPAQGPGLSQGDSLETRRMEFIPKRAITLIVEDSAVRQVVDLIMAVNRTGHVGDGRIFVCPLEEAVRIRTAETGNEAIL
ncbi:MAG: P-II family nitrogen regulator [Clostridia bacterium]|nr:MAG: P-II family nitrogen regulator [Clostridia bacterium]